MRELPYITMRLQNVTDVTKVKWSIDDQWLKYAESIVKLVLSNPGDLETVYIFLCTWATFCFNHFQCKPSPSNEYITKTTFPDFTINACLIIS